MKTIGMIGIGMMGHGIASNLLKHGQSLTVLEHPGNQPLDTLLAAGARTCTTPQALAAQSDVVPAVLFLSDHGESLGEDVGVRRSR